MLVQTYGETWRQLKNGWITPIAGWLIALVAVVIGAFFKWRGSIKVHGAPTGRLIERFTPLERYTHWVVAISFVILGVSGLVMMLGKYVLLPVIGYTLFAWLAQLSKHLHNFVGPVFIVSLLVFIVMFIKDNLPRLYDFKWFANLGGMVSGGHVPSGRFNAGEKVWFWIGVVVLSLIVSASGLVLLFPNFDQVPGGGVRGDAQRLRRRGLGQGTPRVLVQRREIRKDQGRHGRWHARRAAGPALKEEMPI